METIGKYRIEEKIGSGGFGEVFKGYDPFIKRHVAIKTCISEDAEVTSRFFQEAEIAGNLHHKNITTVYDFGIHDELPYLIQEYLSGEDLDVKIKRRDYLPYPEKLFYLLQVARGLAHAHSKGVIHRDIKPANVRVLEDGTTKIMDFGIAKLAQQETGLTQTGMTLGTAAYLAPEQVRGEAVDLRTDIFSYGVLAYELLTYERPFQGDQISTVLYHLLHKEPEPITVHWPGAPPELVALIDRCLRKDMAQRFADGGELVQELESLQKRDRRRRPAVAPATADRAAAAPAAAIPEPGSTRPIQATSATRPREAGGPGISKIEYQPAADRTPVAAATGTRVAGRSRLATLGRTAILLLLAGGAAAGGWWLGTRDRSAGTGDTATSDQQPEVGLAEMAGEPGPEAPAPSGSEEPPPALTEQPPEPQSPPPPAPTTGKLILPRVEWTDRMTVRIGSRSYELGRGRTIEMPAGRHEAVFEVTGGGYRPASRRIEIRVVAGESQRVSVPIPRPGAISVRPLPGRPQGEVFLDGEFLGPTPLSRILREPKGYTLEIRRRGDDSEGLTQEVTLEPGQEVILSFDLEAGQVRTGAKALKL